jgi:hypothetical protein
VIGGHDMVLRLGLTKAAATSVVDVLLRREWPQLVVDTGDDGEIFVYETSAARDSWERDGKTDDNDDQLIHIVYSEDSTTFVTSLPGSNTHRIAANICYALARTP